MNAHRLHLRYRPAADILIGAVSLDMFTADTPSHEQPDADTSYTWTPLIDGFEVLTGFQLVHAAARFSEPATLQLPPAVADHARRLVRAARTAGAATPHAITTALDCHHDITLRQLRRGAGATHIPDAWTLPEHHHTEVSATLDFIADQLDQIHAVQHGAVAPAVGSALREVSRSTRTQLPAPGAVAAARLAVRAERRLAPAIRHDLLTVLASAADPSRMADAYDAAISLQSQKPASRH